VLIFLLGYLRPSLGNGVLRLKSGRERANLEVDYRGFLSDQRRFWARIRIRMRALRKRQGR
jgi:hypothetical protein